MQSTGLKIAIVTIIVFIISMIIQVKGNTDNQNIFINEDLDVAGLPRIIDFGSDCLTCARMIPILNEIKEEFKGRVIVEMVNVYENTSKTSEYKIIGTPTQVFLDENGAEVYRHVGVYSALEIKAKLEEMGIK